MVNKEYASEYNKRYYEENKEKLKEYKHQYYLKHKEKLNKLNKEYIKKHPNLKKEIQKRYYYTHLEQIQENRNANKEYRKEYDKQYRIKNKEEIKKKRRIYQQERLQKDELFKLKRQIRSNIRTSFKKKGIIKDEITEKIIGMPLNDFYFYLLETYKKNYGIEWDGKRIVHIDHIKPLKTANNKDDVLKLCHYSNLQLLTAKDNLEKHDKLELDKMFG